VNIKVESNLSTLSAQSPFEAELAALIVESLHLEISLACTAWN
jgi:hypothetical protein